MVNENDVTVSDLGQEGLEQPNLNAQSGDAERISVALQELLRDVIADLDSFRRESSAMSTGPLLQKIERMANELEVAVSNIVGG